MPVRLDLNNPEFQKQWFSLEREDRIAVLNCCVKLAGMEWNAVYRDKGLRWEVVHSRTGVERERLYSIRLSQKARAIVRRHGEFLQFLSLHADRDSAYR